jgi:hypothetical protein
LKVQELKVQSYRTERLSFHAKLPHQHIAKLSPPTKFGASIITFSSFAYWYIFPFAHWYIGKFAHLKFSPTFAHGNNKYPSAGKKQFQKNFQ